MPVSYMGQRVLVTSEKGIRVRLMNRKSAFLVVDVQNDFALPSGALSVESGEEIIPLVLSIRALDFAAVIYTQDFHPPGHVSFIETHMADPAAKVFQPYTLPNGHTQMMWPTHCVQGTPGADFHAALDIDHSHRTRAPATGGLPAVAIAAAPTPVSAPAPAGRPPLVPTPQSSARSLTAGAVAGAPTVHPSPAATPRRAAAAAAGADACAGLPALSPSASTEVHSVLHTRAEEEDCARSAQQQPSAAVVAAVAAAPYGSTAPPQRTFGVGLSIDPDAAAHSRAIVVQKGLLQHVDSYSGFFDNDRTTATELRRILHERGVTDIYVAGLAYDYCVAYTALDAKALGFNVAVVSDACRAVAAESAHEMTERMERAGVRILTAADVMREMCSPVAVVKAAQAEASVLAHTDTGVV